MQKVDGVQLVRVSLKDGTTTLELRPDNRVTIAQLRKVIRNSGFVSKEVQVLARGSVLANGFDVLGTGERLSTANAPVAAEAARWRFTVPAPR